MPASLKHLTNKKLNLTSLLARWNDGLYYTAAIVRCDKANKRCLVCFEDGSEVWVNNRDVHLQLSLDQLNEDEDIVCCICDVGDSEPPNEIILCDVCQQGYHQKCHNPPVDSSKIDESEDTDEHKDWFCATCSYILNQSNRAKLSATVQQQQQHQKQQQKEQESSSPKKQTEQNTSAKQEQSTSKQEPKHSKQVTVKSQPQQSAQAQTKPQRLTTQPKVKTPDPPQQSSPAHSTSSTQSIELSLKQSSAQKQQNPAKSAKLSSSPQPNQKTTTVPIVKTTTSPVPKQAPYYPLSNQARPVASSSTAALATMTASSALVVGSSAGRTKQDLVNQSNKSSKRLQRSSGGSKTETTTPSPPVKHAVRKSSINFGMPVKQSALPTATRSVLPSLVTPAKVPRLMLVTSSPTAQQLVVPQTTLVTTPSQSTTCTFEGSNSSIKSPSVKERQPHVSSQSVVSLNGTSSTSSNSNISPTSLSVSASTKNSAKLTNVLTKDINLSPTINASNSSSNTIPTTKTIVNDNNSNNNQAVVTGDTSNETKTTDLAAQSVSVETAPE